MPCARRDSPDVVPVGPWLQVAPAYAQNAAAQAVAADRAARRG